MRIGLEDHHYTDQGKLSNPQIAEQASATIRAMGHQVATPGEAREILEMTGGAAGPSHLFWRGSRNPALSRRCSKRAMPCDNFLLKFFE